MKCFTPELIVMGQASDDQVLNEQARLWDEAGERYVGYLDSVRPRFPVGLRHLDESYYLHDAIIRGMGKRDQSFVIILQLDTPPQSILTFTYDLVSDPVVIKDALPARSPGCAARLFPGVSDPVVIKDALPEEFSGGGSIVDWQYDEINMVAGEPPTWRQSILLGNGWEVSLHFRDVQVQEVQAVLPAPRNGAVTGVSFVLQHPAQV